MSDLERLERGKGEQGSVIVAMTIIAILALLSAAVLARTLSGQTSARQAQEFAAALGPADAGVSDTLFRLDQIGSDNPPWSGNTYCVGSAACEQLALIGAGNTQYIATYDPVTDRVTVRSKGVVNGRPHGVQAEITRSGAFPFAIFGVSALRFNGNSPGLIRTVDANGQPVASPDADAGTNGVITCSGASGGGESNVAYPGGAIDSSCANPELLDEGQFLPKAPVAVSDCSQVPLSVPETPCIDTDTALPCPANASGVLPSTLVPGRYLCTSSVQFPGGFVTLSANPSVNNNVVEIFVVPPSNTVANVALGTTGVGGRSDINRTGAGVAGDGDPTRLRLYMAGGGVIEPPGGNNAGRFVGIVYAPQSGLTANGCQEEWRGALVFNSATCNGGPNLKIDYDVRVAQLKDSNWSVDNYHEIPSSQVVIP